MELPHPPLQGALSSSNDTSVSLSMIQGIALPELGLVLTPPWPPTTSALGFITPQPRCNVDIIQCGQLPQQPHPRHQV
jgi:hypothetical protein